MTSATTITSTKQKGQPVCHSKRPCEIEMPNGSLRKMTWVERQFHICQAEQGGY